MYNKNPTLFLFYMLTIFVCGSIIFLIGFFPASCTKFNLDDSVQKQTDLRTNLNGHVLNPPKQKYKQIVLMIIDALRQDFLTQDKMPYACLTACNALALHVDIPTVTMPRLKSMTTGVLSNFIDILFNLGHANAVKDSIIHGLKRRGDIMTFAGDHTWMRLFPNEFARTAANNDSFFVKDFFEGDKNVTQALENELRNKDWSLLIIHYLGLDHIGHVEGTSSLKIPSKLKEMDESVKMIINSMGNNDRLLLLTGDHGMRNGGGHGGSTLEETTVPLFGFNKNCTKKKENLKKYNQIDLAPTLAILFSIEIPQNSIGCLIPELLEDLSFGEQLYAYYYNADHLIEQAIVKFGKDFVHQNDYFNWFANATESHELFLKSIRSNAGRSAFMFEKAKRDYMRMSEEVSTTLAESLVTFEYSLIAIGLCLTLGTASYMLLVVLFTAVRTQNNKKKAVFNRQIVLALLVAMIINVAAHYMHYTKSESIFYSILITLPIAAGLYICSKVLWILLLLVLPLSQSKSIRLNLKLPLPYLAGFLFHTCSLGSSSFIEEEQQSWYYLGPTMLIITLAMVLHKKVQRKFASTNTNIEHRIALEISNMRVPIFMLVIITLLRRLNQTGNKWSHLPDFENYLNNAQHKTSLTIFFIFGLYNLVLSLRPWLTNLQMVAATLATVFVYCFRGVSGVVHMFPVPPSFSSKLMLLCFWACVVVVEAVPCKNLICRNTTYGYEPKVNIVQLLQTNLCCLLLLEALLHKPHNVVLVPALLFTLHVTYRLCDTYLLYCGSATDKTYSLMQKTLLTIFLGNMFYFFQGNSNALSDIDLNPGYIGQSTYQPIIVFIFVTLNTYSAPINGFLFLVVHMFGNQSKSLPQRQEKEQFSNWFIIQTQERDMHLVISLYTAFTMMPVAFYLCLLVTMRYHLFIYSVFAPKAFYGCFSVFVFYLNFIFITFFLKLFKFSV